MTYSPGDLKEKLNKMDIRPKKALGQNFLIYEATIEKIVNKTLSFPTKEIIEVGPGLGALTEGLLKSGKPITLIELDKKFAEYWMDRGVVMHNKDALKMDWRELAQRSTTLVSNLPYQISSSLVVEMSIKEVLVENMVLMFQKEVAERILSSHNKKSYGLLTVIAQVFWKVEFLLEAGPKDFYPPPSIASKVLVFERKAVNMKDRRDFLSFVKAAFHQRRKKLINNLKAYSTDIDWKEVWQKKGWEENLRAENLSPKDYLDLYEVTYEVTVTF